MSRGVLALILALAVTGCSARTVVIQPEDVPKLNDSQWTIKAPPAARSR